MMVVSYTVIPIMQSGRSDGLAGVALFLNREFQRFGPGAAAKGKNFRAEHSHNCGNIPEL